MTASLPDYVWVELGEFTLGVDETRQLPDAHLGHGARLTLSFEIVDPRQLAGIDVRATHRERGQVNRGTVRRARASFLLLRPGAYDLTIRGPNIEPQTLPIQLGAQESRTVQVTLR